LHLVALYNAALTPDEVSSNFAAGAEGRATPIAPVATDGTSNVQGGTSVTIDVVANDQDDPGPSNITIVDGPKQGTVTVNPDGTVTYKHNGIDTFTYTIRDSSGAVSNVGTITVTIE
ncbi:MAG: cadherin-like domain-containing protein, partial [Nitrospina sp.]|nr:cadherin-like domain-containing protein [Nitrospina sp.]